MNNILQKQEIYGIIYKITNLITGKIYIGQTIRPLQSRWKQHKRDVKKYDFYLYRSIRKYGIENFIIKEIDHAYSKDELNQKEYEWIIKQDCLAPNGYNLVNGGLRAGYSEETLDKHRKSSAKNKIWIHNPETMERKMIYKTDEIPINFIIGLGPVHSEEHKIKVGNSRRNKPRSKETKQKLRDANLNKSLSTETKEKISQGCKGKTKNYRWIYNPSTDERRKIPENEELPENFIYGYFRKK